MKMDETRPPEDPGDHTVVGRLIPRWVGSVKEVLSAHRGPSLCTVWRAANGTWEVVVSVDRRLGQRQRHFIAVDIDGMRSDRWHLIQLGPGVWEVSPSLLVPGQIHAFVTLVGVPEPPPWRAT